MTTRETAAARDIGPAAARAIEIPWMEPLACFAAFAQDPFAALLDSAAEGPTGRYSYVAAEPFAVATAADGRMTVDGRPQPGDPWDALRALLSRHAEPSSPGLPPFQGGAVGYLGYELGRHLESVPVAPVDDMRFPDLALLLCDVVVAFDHHDRRAWVVSSGAPARDPAVRAARAGARLDRVLARVLSTPPLSPPPSPRDAPLLSSTFTRRGYEAAVQGVIDRILAGDLFQANLSQRFTTDLPGGLSPFDLYRRLRAANPAPFASFLKLGEVTVASSSPERFLRLDDGHVETRPIKGTRPRGRTPEEDAALAAELLSSEKDRAENVMIVDLLRNDLSRVCRDGSVTVPTLCGLERFATVMHLVSAVTGTLRRGAGAVDLLAACFPGGSITGAPKIRAMEVIAELEPTRRGPYCGAIGWLGFDGGMDTSVVIRTFAMHGRQVTFHAGGGVVAGSSPRDEYRETLAKARALVSALRP